MNMASVIQRTYFVNQQVVWLFWFLSLRPSIVVKRLSSVRDASDLWYSNNWPAELSAVDVDLSAKTIRVWLGCQQNSRVN